MFWKGFNIGNIEKIIIPFIIILFSKFYGLRYLIIKNKKNRLVGRTWERGGIGVSWNNSILCIKSY